MFAGELAMNKMEKMERVHGEKGSPHALGEEEVLRFSRPATSSSKPCIGGPKKKRGEREKRDGGEKHATFLDPTFCGGGKTLREQELQKKDF